MRGEQVRFGKHSLVAAFVIGVILFAVLWKTMFSFASSEVILAGMAGVAVAVTVFGIWYEFKGRNKEN